MKKMTLRLAVISMLAICLLPAAAGPPTSLEWEPFEKELAAKTDGIRQKLKAFMAGRTWADGWVILAGLDREAGDFPACLEHAERGLSQSLAQPGLTEHLERVRTDACWLTIHALTQLGRADEADPVLKRLGQRRDIGGAAHFAAAQARHSLGNTEGSLEHLTKALALCQEQHAPVPASYRYLQAMLYEIQAAAYADAGGPDAKRLQTEKLEAAADCYKRALQGDDANPDALFNLARMERQLAFALPEKRAEYLQGSLESYRLLRKIAPDDLEGVIGMGLVLLDREEYHPAHNSFAEAIKAVEGGRELAIESTRTAFRGRGSAILKLAEAEPFAWTYQSAYDDLIRAKDSGDDAPDLWANLMVAALKLRQQSTDQTTRDRLQAVADEAREKAGYATSLNTALADFESARELLAKLPTEEEAQAKVLNEARERVGTAVAVYANAVGAALEKPDDWQMEKTPENRELGPIWRYLGHASVVLGRIESQAGRPQQAAAAYQMGLQAYKVGGDLVDHDARRSFLHLAGAIDAPTGYQGGWTFLGWKSYLSFSGWAAVIGNYGASQAWKSPLHIIFWCVLIGIPALIGLKGMLLGKKLPAPASGGNRRPAKVEDTSKGAKPGSRKAVPAADPAESARANKAKDATLMPNSEMAQNTGALERRDAPVAKKRKKPASSPAVNDETAGYDPASAPGRTAVDGAPKVNKAAEQVAKRLQQQQQAAKSSKPPARRRRR